MANEPENPPDYHHPQPAPLVAERVPLWRFTRTLSCTLVYEKRDFVVEVEPDPEGRRSRRFKFEAQAVAYAESLREQMDAKTWTRVPVPVRKLRGQR